MKLETRNEWSNALKKHGKKRGTNKPFVLQRVAERREDEVKDSFGVWKSHCGS